MALVLEHLQAMWWQVSVMSLLGTDTWRVKTGENWRFIHFIHKSCLYLASVQEMNEYVIKALF